MTPRQPGLDSIQEFRVENNSSSARYARPTSIIATTKGGTNAIHGTAFETNRNSGYRRGAAAAGHLRPSRSYLNRNEFGVSAGGPIYIPKIYNGKNKAFWFSSWEWSAPDSSQHAAILSADARRCATATSRQTDQQQRHDPPDDLRSLDHRQHYVGPPAVPGQQAPAEQAEPALQVPVAGDAVADHHRDQSLQRAELCRQLESAQKRVHHGQPRRLPARRKRLVLRPLLPRPYDEPQPVLRRPDHGLGQGARQHPGRPPLPTGATRLRGSTPSPPPSSTSSCSPAPAPSRTPSRATAPRTTTPCSACPTRSIRTSGPGCITWHSTAATLTRRRTAPASTPSTGSSTTTPPRSSASTNSSSASTSAPTR